MYTVYKSIYIYIYTVYELTYIDLHIYTIIDLYVYIHN